MAVKTKFSKDELIEALANYDLGDFEGSKPIPQGSVQTNYFIQTTRGKYVFRVYENRPKESVLFECNLIKYLQDKKYPCPAVYPDKRGRYVGIHHKKPYALFEFIDGQPLENPTQAQRKQLIRRVAELNILTKNYRPRYKKYRWNYSVELGRELAYQAAQQTNTSNAYEKLEWYKQELSKLNLPNSLPKGVCHCDFHFSNILFKDGDFAALIDFDDANYTYLTYDLVTLINPFIRIFNWDTWSHFSRDEKLFDFREARNTVAEYMQVRPLKAIEKRHLFDVYKLSILIDCIWYFDRGEAGDFYERRKIEALNRLGREEFYGALF